MKDVLSFVLKNYKEKYKLSIFGGCDVSARNLAGDLYDLGFDSSEVFFVSIRPKKGTLILKEFSNGFKGWVQHVVLECKGKILDPHLSKPVLAYDYFNKMFRGKTKKDLILERESSQNYFNLLEEMSLSEH